MSYVVIYEHVTEPSFVVGPFDDKAVAAAYAEKNHADAFEVWRVVEIKAPAVEAKTEAAKAP